MITQKNKEGKKKIVVVEDESIISYHIEFSLKKLGYDVISPAKTFEEGLEKIINHQPDLVLLDIELSTEKDGVELGQIIHDKFNIPFIFLSGRADKNTIDRAKKVKPQSYLVKPFNDDDLFSSVEIALHNHEESFKKEFLFIKEKTIINKIRIADILYLKSDHVYIEIITVNDNRHIVRGSMKEYESKLTKDFVAINRSYIVNLAHIDSIEQDAIQIQDYKIAIGKTFKTDFLNKINF